MTVFEPSTEPLEEQLRRIAIESSSIDEAELRGDSDLLEVVDSLGVAELFEFVEERLGRPLREDEMTRETFGTIAAIAKLIRSEGGA